MGKRIFKSVLHVAPPPQTAAPTPAPALRADLLVLAGAIRADVVTSRSPPLGLTFLVATIVVGSH